MKKDNNHNDFTEHTSWNKDEQEAFEQWLKEGNHAELFKQWLSSEKVQKDLIRLHYLEKRKGKNLKRFTQAMEHSTTARMRWHFISTAASLLLVIGLGIYTWSNHHSMSQTEAFIPTVYDTPTLHMTPHMEYQLDDISNNIEIMGVKIHISQDHIAYTQTSLANSNDSLTDSIPHNTLKVPKGRMYEIKLADGTHVKLNSDSELSYPISFNGKPQRTVYLNGEAYFEVKADSTHPFIVRSPHLNTQVYGTKFNVKSYRKDLYGAVLLEEGKLDVTTKNNQTIRLQPGDYMTSNILGEVTKEPNTPAANIIYWQENKFFFQNQRLLEIAKDLERKFDVRFYFDRPETARLTFFARTQRCDHVETILDILCFTHKIDYRIEGRNIYITKK